MWKEMQTLPPDGRQSETALMIARGVRRLLRARGFSSLTELPLTDGRRADIAAVNRDGEVLSRGQVMRRRLSRRSQVAGLRRLLRPALFRHFGAHVRRFDARGDGPHRRGNRARSRTAAPGPSQPPRAVAALRPGRRRPAAPPVRSGSDAGISGAATRARKKRAAPQAALNRSCDWAERLRRRAPIDPSSSGGPPRSRGPRNQAPSSPRSRARELRCCC
jgi:hypothetical protein